MQSSGVRLVGPADIINTSSQQQRAVVVAKLEQRGRRLVPIVVVVGGAILREVVADPDSRLSNDTKPRWRPPRNRQRRRHNNGHGTIPWRTGSDNNEPLLFHDGSLPVIRQYPLRKYLDIRPLPWLPFLMQSMTF